jgi:hypothetical protein
MFQEPEQAARSFPTAAIAIAALLVLLIVAGLLVFGRRRAGPAAAATGTANAAYAPQLVLSDVQMSESTSLSGAKETFVDGRIANRGTSTVVGATAEVTFPADGVDPQVEAVPVTLIRTRQPYIDTEPMSAEPLAPGATGEFRLTFDDVRPDWNQQVPVIRVTGVTLK